MSGLFGGTPKVQPQVIETTIQIIKQFKKSIINQSMMQQD